MGTAGLGRLPMRNRKRILVRYKAELAVSDKKAQQDGPHPNQNGSPDGEDQPKCRTSFQAEALEVMKVGLSA